MKLKPQRVIVNGPELPNELARLKAAGASVESIDCRVGGKNSAYQINFVESVMVRTAKTVTGPGPVKPGNGAMGVTPIRATPSTTCLVGESPTTLNSNVAGRTSLISEVTSKSERERQMEETPPDTVNSSISRRVMEESQSMTGRSSNAGHAGPAALTIEQRISRLKSVAMTRGMVRRDKTREARLPHAE